MEQESLIGEQELVSKIKDDQRCLYDSYGVFSMLKKQRGMTIQKVTENVLFKSYADRIERNMQTLVSEYGYEWDERKIHIRKNGVSVC